MRRLMMGFLIFVSCTSSQPSANLTQAASFDQAAATASNRVAQYRQAATSATTPAECTAALQQYIEAMQPSLDQMRSPAGRLDSYMKSAGNATAGDMGCGVQVMADEVAHHEAVACTSPDMAVNHAEAQRHADAMQLFANHMEMRAEQAAGLMTQAGMTGPGHMTGGNDGGWMMPDGGVMDFGQEMPGCTYVGGGYQAPDGGYLMDGGWVSPGSMMDGGLFDGALAGGAQRCQPPASCPGPAMMAPNYVCPDETVAGPACVALADGTCAWRMLTCP
jgi:hypothetical protein